MFHFPLDLISLYTTAHYQWALIETYYFFPVHSKLGIYIDVSFICSLQRKIKTKTTNNHVSIYKHCHVNNLIIMIMCDNQNIFEWDFFSVGNQQILFKLQVLLCIFCRGCQVIRSICVAFSFSLFVQLTNLPLSSPPPSLPTFKAFFRKKLQQVE